MSPETKCTRKPKYEFKGCQLDTLGSQPETWVCPWANYLPHDIALSSIRLPVPSEKVLSFSLNQTSSRGYEEGFATGSSSHLCS